MKNDVKLLLEASHAASCLTAILNKCAFIGVDDSAPDVVKRWNELKERMDTMLLPDNVGQTVFENRQQFKRCVAMLQRETGCTHEQCAKALHLNKSVDAARKYLKICAPTVSNHER